LRQSSDRRQ